MSLPGILNPDRNIIYDSTGLFHFRRTVLQGLRLVLARVIASECERIWTGILAGLSSDMSEERDV